MYSAIQMRAVSGMGQLGTSWMGLVSLRRRFIIHIDELVQERRHSCALLMEMRISYIQCAINGDAYFLH